MFRDFVIEHCQAQRLRHARRPRRNSKAMRHQPRQLIGSAEIAVATNGVVGRGTSGNMTAVAREGPACSNAREISAVPGRKELSRTGSPVFSERSGGKTGSAPGSLTWGWRGWGQFVRPAEEARRNDERTSASQSVRGGGRCEAWGGAGCPSIAPLGEDVVERHLN